MISNIVNNCNSLKNQLSNNENTFFIIDFKNNINLKMIHKILKILLNWVESEIEMKWLMIREMIER